MDELLTIEELVNRKLIKLKPGPETLHIGIELIPTSEEVRDAQLDILADILVRASLRRLAREKSLLK